MKSPSRVLTVIAAGALAVGTASVATAQDLIVYQDGSKTNLGQCVSEAKQALKGTGVKLKVGQFDNIVLGTNGPDTFTPTDGRDLFCGFDGPDGIVPEATDAGDVFVGGDGDDQVSINYGVFLGGNGSDSMFYMQGGHFDGGAGNDGVYSQYNAGACTNVEYTLGCPAP